jgi:hypothetical protein
MSDISVSELYRTTIERYLEAGYAPPKIDRNKAPSAVRAAQEELREHVGLTSNFLFDWLDSQERRMKHGKTHWMPNWNKYPPLAAKAGVYGFDPVLPGFEISKVTTVLDENGSTERSFISQRPERPREPYEVFPGQVIDRVSAYLDADKNWQGGWIKTKKDAPDFLASIEALKETFAEYAGLSALPPEPSEVVDSLTNYVIGDHHLGMYAWKAETGEDYDLQIGENILMDAMTKLVQRSPNSDTAMVISMGDFFHTDSSNNQTSRSHNALDVDTRRAKVFKIGVNLMVKCIELALQKHKKVIVRTLPGNHDAETTPTLAIALWAFFQNNDRVEVDINPSNFFFYQFGKTMIAGTHGDQAKLQDMPLIMASRQAKMWGETVFRYAYGGHVHHKSRITQKELGGVIAETFQILAPADSWHSNMGYGAGRSMTSITYTREGGEESRQIVNIVPSDNRGPSL